MDTLVELFARGARRAGPDAPLLFLPDGTTVTFGEVEAEAGRVAAGLVRAGVGVGDRVAVQAEKSPAVLFTYLACLRLGAVFLPMNPAYTDDEARHIVDDAEPTVVVRSEDDLAALAEAGTVAGEEPGQATVGPEELAALLYTSGTTGRPKGAMLSHRNLAANAEALRVAWGFRDGDVVLHALPIFHAHGLFVAVHCSLANGTPMVFLPRFDAGQVIDHLAQATVFMGVPTFYTRLLAEERFDVAATRTIRLFVSGSAPLSAEVHRKFEERTGHRILERYGMTETTMLTSNPLDGDRRAGTVGVPLPGVEVRLADADGESGVGGIEVRGPSVFEGYWRRPELRASEFTADGWFRTGDLGRFDDDGYLSIVGRSKDLVITGGLNVYPKEVEGALDALDGVEESAVVGLPDDDFGEAVVAAVVAEPGAALDAEALRSQVRSSLAGYKVPKRIVVVDALPRNAMGKVEKARLRAELAGDAAR